MRYRSIYIVQLILLIFSPLFTLAQTGNGCSSVGYTVLTINGIWTTEAEAKANKEELELWIQPQGGFNGEPIYIDYLHNESHLGGGGDIVKTLKQIAADGEVVDDYDLSEMLRSASDKVKSRKLLLVAHSQGNFYANALHRRMVQGVRPDRSVGAVPKESVAVYSVATPASFVAGGGEYLTSETDRAIAWLVGKALGGKILPPNTRIEEAANDRGLSAGHHFAEVYLKYRGAEIVEGVERALDKLKAESPHPPTPSPRGRERGGVVSDGADVCIPAPALTLAHKAAGLAFAALDPALEEAKENLKTAAANVAAAGRKVTHAGLEAARAAASVLDSAPLVIEVLDAGAAIALTTPAPAPEPPPVYSYIPTNVGVSDETPVYTNVLQNTALDTEVNERNNPEPGLSYAEVLENISITTTQKTQTDKPVNPVYAPLPIPVGPGGFRGGGGGGSTSLTASGGGGSSSATSAVAASSEAKVEEEEDEPEPAPAQPSAPTPGAIVINEIAWKGTIASVDDEWVELYNTTSGEVSLASTTLLAADGSPYIPLSGSIAARQYFLIERKQTGETSEAAGSPLSDITANLWTSFGTGLSDTGEVLTLAYFDGTATTTIDTAGFSDCASWCGLGGGGNFVSLERIAPSHSGTAPASWLGNKGNTTGMRNGTARNGDSVHGTPGAKNYASFLVNGGNNLSEGSLTLTAEGSPYLVNSAWLTVGSGATLTIEAGAIVKFYNTAGIKVDGTLTIAGAALNPAILTSFFDDSYGGDTNLDGNGTAPAAGDWYGVEYRAGALGSIEGALVRYGGKFFNDTPATRASIALTESSPAISNSTFEYGSRYGLLLTNASSTISNNIFRNHAVTGDSYGIAGSGGAPTISNNTFSDNSVGLYFSDSSGTFSTNTFTNNTNGAFTWGGNLKGAGRITGNSGTGNGSYNGVRFPSSNLVYGGVSSVFSKNASTFPYLVLNPSAVPAGATLTAEAGSVWKFDRWPLNVYGTLFAQGTAAENVLFSSIYDNESPVPVLNGTGIYLQNGSVSDFTHATIRYMNTALSYESAPLSLENVSLEGNALGIYGTASTTITKALNVSFVGNGATSTIPIF